MTSLEAASTEHVERLRKSGVPYRGYADAGRHLVRLAVPGALVHVPLALLTLPALTVAARGSAAVVNQRFQLIGTSDDPTLLWVLAAVVLAGQFVVFPATVVIATGHLLDRPVPPVEALRAAVRRLPALLVVGVPVSVAAGAAALVAADQRWPAVLALVVAGCAAMPVLLAVPAVLLHGCSGPGAIRRAYRLTRRRFLPTALTLAAGVVLVPAGTIWALQAGLGLLPGPAATLGWGLAGTVGALAVTPFQAAVVARQFLHCMAWRTGVDDSDLSRGLPGGPPPKPVPAGLLPVALLPGLLFGGVVLVNPFGWPEVAETITEPRTVSSRGREPVVRPFDLQDLHLGRDGGPVAVLDGFQDHASLLTCADPSCRETSLTWAEPLGSGTQWEPGAASTRLPDGRLLLTAWTSGRLVLLTCEATTCVRGGTVATTRAPPESAGVALAARPGGGLVVALADDDPATGDRPAHDLISFVFCAEPGCARPERRRVARLEAAGYSPTDHNLAIAVGPGDRPVAARLDSANGQIHVISCPDADCHRPRVTRPVPPVPSSADDWPWTSGLALAVRPDGRPVIAYRDPHDQAYKLLDCRTPDCGAADTRTLGAGSEYHAAPVLALDRAGRPLVAFQSREHQRLMLAVCTGGHCESIPVARNERGFGDKLAMTLNAGGDPAIAWIGYTLVPSGLRWNLHVTTPLNLTADDARAGGRAAPGGRALPAHDGFPLRRRDGR